MDHKQHLIDFKTSFKSMKVSSYLKEAHNVFLFSIDK